MQQVPYDVKVTALDTLSWPDAEEEQPSDWSDGGPGGVAPPHHGAVRVMHACMCHGWDEAANCRLPHIQA
jgi:hypothetical protein